MRKMQPKKGKKWRKDGEKEGKNWLNQFKFQIPDLLPSNLISEYAPVSTSLSCFWLFSLSLRLPFPMSLCLLSLP